MPILHIYKSPPDEVTSTLVSAIKELGEGVEFHLYQDEVDYDSLLELIFQSDKVICWF